VTASRPKVVVTAKLPDAVERRAREMFDVTLNPTDTPLTAPQLLDCARSADGLLPTVTDKISAELLGAAGRTIRIVANYGVGFNNVDITAAKANGVVVTNTPDVLTDDTADIAIALMFMAARRLGEGERMLRAGRWTGWRPTQLLGTKVTGKTLGIIGLGRIGRAVAKRAHDGFGMRVVYFDPPVPIGEAKALGAEPRGSLEDVLRESDFVSLHAPSLPETRHLMNARTLALMQPHAILINTARGDIVDEAALVAALKAGTIAGAGLDVFEQEPKIHPELVTLENVALLPHLGSATTETRVAMGNRALDNLELFFAGKPPRDRVA
jgi:lactate dehydrogenase-like 2-hydroxyacid dehydrogenase